MNIPTRQRFFVLSIATVGLELVLYSTTLALQTRSQRANCLHNIRQMSLATMLYTRDYDETYMLASNWKTALAPYVGFKRSTSYFVCPESGRDYAYNINLSSKYTGLIPFNKHYKMAMFYEPTTPTHADDGKQWVPQGVHDGGSHVSFTDGHAKWLQTKPVFWIPELKQKRK